jgi:hypothetical protein
MQIKTVMRFHLTPGRRAIIKKEKMLKITNAGEDVEKKELKHCWREEYKLAQPLWKIVWKFPNKLKIEL